MHSQKLSKIQTPKHVLLYDLVKTNIDNEYYYSLCDSIRNLESEYNCADLDLDTRVNTFYKIVLEMCRKNTNIPSGIMTTQIHNIIHKEFLQFGLSTYFKIIEDITRQTKGCRLILASPFINNDFIDSVNSDARFYIGLSCRMLWDYYITRGALRSFHNSPEDQVALNSILEPNLRETLWSNLIEFKRVWPNMLNHLWSVNLQSEFNEYILSLNLKVEEETMANEIAVYLIDPNINSPEMRNCMMQCMILKQRGYRLFLFHSTTNRTSQISTELFEDDPVTLPPIFNLSIAQKLIERPFRAIFTDVQNGWTQFFKLMELSYTDIYSMRWTNLLPFVIRKDLETTGAEYGAQIGNDGAQIGNDGAQIGNDGPDASLVKTLNTNSPLSFYNYGYSIIPIQAEKPQTNCKLTRDFILCTFSPIQMRQVDIQKLNQFIKDNNVILSFMVNNYNCPYENNTTLEANIELFGLPFVVTQWSFEEYLFMLGKCKYFAAFEPNVDLLDAVRAKCQILDLNTIELCDHSSLLNEQFVVQHNQMIKEQFSNFCDSIELFQYSAPPDKE